jgi:hypothetical protein
MRHIFSACLLSLLYVSSFSQSKPIELYDLVKALAPDSTSSVLNISWNNAALRSMPVNWQGTQPTESDKKYSLRGTVAVSLYGKTFSCDGTNNPCTFKINMIGNQSGYQSFLMDHGISKNINPEQSINYLFNQSLKFRVYQKIADTGNATLYAYEIKMPAKRPIWLMYATIRHSSGNGIFLKGFINEKDLLAEIAKSGNNAKTSQATTKADGKLTPAAALLFKNIKTKLSNNDKNALQKLLDMKKTDNDNHIYPTDLNNDGVEEIFVQYCDYIMYGNAGCATLLYMKDEHGYYVQQEPNCPYFSARAFISKGFPDLICGGPGFKFAVYRFDGKKYRYLKNNEEIKDGDRGIEDISDAYTKSMNGGAAIQPKPAVTTPAPEKAQNKSENLQYLINDVAKQQSFISNNQFQNRLKKLMGKDYKTLLAYSEMDMPPVIENGLYYYWGMQPHHGGENEAMIIADIPNNALYVKLLKDEKDHFYSEDGKQTIPANIMSWATKMYNKGRQ